MGEITTTALGPSYQAIIDAARRADAQGNTDDARRLVEIAKKRYPDQVQATLNSGSNEHLARFRQQYPQYGDMGDQNLAEALHRRFYSDMPKGAYMEKLGLQDPAREQALTNAQAKQAADFSAEDFKEAARKAYADGDVETARSLIERAKKAEASPSTSRGGSEVGLTGGTSAAVLDGGMMGFGDEYLAGLSAVLGLQPDGRGGSSWFNYGKPIGQRYSTALDAIRDEQKQFATEQPVAAIGGETLGAILGAGKGAGSFIGRGASTAARLGRGSAVGAAGGASYAFGEGEGGTVARAAEMPLGAILGGAGGGVVTGAGEGLGRAVSALSRNSATSRFIPSVESLKAAADDLFAKVDASGATVPAKDVRTLAQKVTGRLQHEGYDPDLHPRLKAVLRRLATEDGPKTISEMQILRRVVSNAAQSIQPDERRLASMVLDDVDDTVSRLGGASKDLEAARSAWGRMRRLEIIEDLIDRASQTQNFQQSLKTQFRSLLRNKKRLRGFTPEEVKAIRAVASGTSFENALRGLSRLLSPNSVSGVALTGGGLYTAGPAALALPASSYASKKIADALLKGRTEAARRAVAGASSPALPANRSGVVALPLSAYLTER